MPVPAIDVSVHHDWVDQEELVPYLPGGWRAFVTEASTLPGQVRQLRMLDEELPIRSPRGPLHADAVERVRGGARGVTDPADACTWTGASVAVLTYGAAAHFPMHGHTDLGVAVCAAMNDWTADRWLTPDRPELYGSIILPTQSPDAAVTEIRRHGSNPRMAHALITANGLGKPLGHPLYEPIYRAAVEHELPVAVLIGSDAAAHTTTHQVSVAPPATYSEYSVLAVQAFMTHLMSLVGQGVFERLPDLRVLLIGGGVGWLPSALWRDDACYRAFGITAPWVTRSPSAYVCDHVRIATYQLDAPEELAVAAAALPRLGEMLCFASGYPRADAGTVADTASVLPDGWADAVLHANAASLYRGRVKLDSREQPARVGAGERTSEPVPAAAERTAREDLAP